MDLVGPMGVSDTGYRYVMTVIDVFTRYLITIPLRSKEACEVAESFYISITSMQGVPQTSDAGGSVPVPHAYAK